jgi:hypothetical protein
MLALAAVLIGWNAIKGARVAKAKNLRALDGSVIEYRTGTASQRYGVTSGKRFRGSAQPVNVLRIQTADGKVTEFSSSDWIHPPTLGWRRGQPIRVKYDSGRDLYEDSARDLPLHSRAQLSSGPRFVTRAAARRVPRVAGKSRGDRSPYRSLASTRSRSSSPRT